jgi:hypothetical protein
MAIYWLAEPNDSEDDLESVLPHADQDGAVTATSDGGSQMLLF